MKKIRLISMVLLTSAAGACGFHLKGQANQHASPIQAIYLECECDDAVAASIVGQLQARNVRLISVPTNGLAVTLSDAQENTFNTVIGDNDQSKEVDLTAGFTVRVARNGELLGERRIESNAYVQYNSDTYLGSNSEAAETRSRLYKENVDKLIRYLETLNAQ